MLRIFLVMSLMLCSLFAQIDGHLDIVIKGKTLPKTVVSIAPDSLEMDILSQISKALVDDFIVSGHFEVSSITSLTAYNSTPDILSLSNQGVNLYVNLSAKKEANGSYTLMTKLYDINAKALVLEKNYTTSLEDRFVFLAHRSAISINDYFKAPSIAWMEKFVVFSVYDGPNKADIMIGDYTLTYKKRVVTGGLNIFPKWANKDQKTIYYTFFHNYFNYIFENDEINIEYYFLNNQKCFLKN